MTYPHILVVIKNQKVYNYQQHMNTPQTTTEFDEFLIPRELNTIEKRIEDQFPEELVNILQKISHQIAEVGLSEKEACIINDYPHETFLKLKKRYPVVVELMAIKDLEYKKSLLTHISKKAKSGDDKMAVWLLTAKYSDEFNPRKGTGGGISDGDNLIAAGLEFVREHGDSNNLITKESGRAFIIRKGGNIEGQDPLTDIKELLN